MQIRAARPEEYEAIGELTVVAYRHLIGSASLGSYEDELRAVGEHAATCAVLVAVDDLGALIGSVTYVPTAGTPMSEFTDLEAAGIRVLAVSPPHQGSGAGRSLTESCISRARAEGRRRVILHSTPVMEVARAMYGRMGFVRMPSLDSFVTRPPYSADEPLHLLAYALEL